MLRGQSSAANSRTRKFQTQPPQFGAISIKPTAPNDDKIHIQRTPDDTLLHGAAVLIILQTAFEPEDESIVAAPSWVNTKRSDVQAKVNPEDAPKLEKLKSEVRCGMLIGVLTEGFNQKYHHETRLRPAYGVRREDVSTPKGNAIFYTGARPNPWLPPGRQDWIDRKL